MPVPHTKKQSLQRGNRRKKTTYLTNGSLNDRDRGGEGLVGPLPHHFFAPPPPLFALKRKIIKIKKRLETSFFRLYSAIFSVFSLISNARHFVGLLCFLRKLCPGADLPLDQTPCLGHHFSSFGSVFCTSSSGRVFFISFIKTK